jgi:hypothetical protein
MAWRDHSIATPPEIPSLMLCFARECTMRFAIVLLAALFSVAAQAQSDIWKPVDPNYNGPRLQSATLNKIKQQAVLQLVMKYYSSSSDSTPESKPDELLKNLTFEEIPLAPNQPVVLVIAPHEGTGGGGEMWLVRFDGDKPALLASPEDNFFGWLYSVQTSTSHGYRDIVLGWHMSAGEADLTYFQFDGKSYVAIGKAKDILDESGKFKIIPDTR